MKRMVFLFLLAATPIAAQEQAPLVQHGNRVIARGVPIPKAPAPKRIVVRTTQSHNTAGMHTHQCPRCGTQWSHVTGSHNCPNCGAYQNVIHHFGGTTQTYTPQVQIIQPQMRTVTQTYSSGGCPGGNCATPASRRFGFGFFN